VEKALAVVPKAVRMMGTLVITFTVWFPFFYFDSSGLMMHTHGLPEMGLGSTRTLVL